MNWNSELVFKLEPVEGDLKLCYNPLSMKLYHNGTEIKRNKGLKPVYEVRTSTGQTHSIKMMNNPFKGYIAECNGEKTHLQRKLSGVELAVGLIPVVVMILCAALFIAITGAIGGALMGGLGVLSVIAGCNVARGDGNLGIKALICLGIGFVCYAVYALIGVMFVYLTHM